MNNLSTDELANIFGFLPSEEIMAARLNKKMRDAAKETIVPMTEFVVDSVTKYNALVVMSTALPNLQQITLRRLGGGHKYSDGEDSYVERTIASTTDNIEHDVSIMSKFSRLHSLKLSRAPLNGRCDFLFHSPLLQKLDISECPFLKLDLEVLAGLPLLKELSIYNTSFAGNISSLRGLKDTLTNVVFKYCGKVTGCFLDLADFRCLKILDLRGTNVRGDVREIGERDFLSLEELTLPFSVCGGLGHEFQHIADVHDFMLEIYSIKKQRPSLLLKDWHGDLSKSSPDWYQMWGKNIPKPPFRVVFVQAGSRIGYQWKSNSARRYACEVIWLDPEPNRESSGYETYVKEMHEIEQCVSFRGFQQPPTAEEFSLLRGFWHNDVDSE